MELEYECDRRWDELDGPSEVIRHCSDCNRHVYNLSGMKRERAERILEVYEGRRLCVHFVSRNGHIIHDGDPLEQLRRQKHGATKLLAAALVIHAGFYVLTGDPGEHYFDPFEALASGLQDYVEEVEEPEQQEVVMGGVMF